MTDPGHKILGSLIVKTSFPFQRRKTDPCEENVAKQILEGGEPGSISMVPGSVGRAIPDLPLKGHRSPFQITGITSKLRLFLSKRYFQASCRYLNIHISCFGTPIPTKTKRAPVLLISSITEAISWSSIYPFLVPPMIRPGYWPLSFRQPFLQHLVSLREKTQASPLLKQDGTSFDKIYPGYSLGDGISRILRAAISPFPSGRTRSAPLTIFLKYGSSFALSAERASRVTMYLPPLS